MTPPPRHALAALAAAVALAGCATPPPVYHAESFTSESPFERFFEARPAVACEAGQRALLSQGYQVDSSQKHTIRGSKFFQPEKNHHMELSISLVCLPAGSGAVMYANARQTRYELKSGASSAGISVAGMGSVSLPWGSSSDALVKVAEETVTDTEFYRRLFALIATLED